MPGWPHERSPFHEGELAFQEKVGAKTRIDVQGRKVIRDYFPDDHLDLLKTTPLFLLGTVDGDGRPWATMATGDPGFLQTPDDKTLRINAAPRAGDPAAAGLAVGAPVGGLAMDFASRRRNRLTAHVASVDAHGVTLALDQSFGNCPQYIQARRFKGRAARRPGAPERFTGLTEAHRAMIARSDTLFIATAIGDKDDPIVKGADVSHRGGRPGFARVEDDGSVVIPDFTGNFHYNTIGNILINPKAGVIFIDYATGDMLSFSGAAAVVEDDPRIAAFRGAERFLKFTPETGVLLPGAVDLVFDEGEPSPNSTMTGSWEEVEANIIAARERDTRRPYRITKIVDESAVIRSFHLEPADGGALIGYRAGQYLPICVQVRECGPAHTRTYTLSSRPTDPAYRISVKKETARRPDQPDGVVSVFLHEKCAVGDIVMAQAPRGGFTIDTTTGRPAVLISAGVGVTPMISMLRHLEAESLRLRKTFKAWFVNASRTADERAFFKDVQAICEANPNFKAVWALEEVAPEAKKGVDHHVHGRLSADVLKEHLPFDDYDFYMCGPPPFMQALYDQLRDLNVSDARIHAEAFGPASMKRRPDKGADLPPPEEPAEAASVRFAVTGKDADWTAADGTLLEFAEAQGLAPSYGCRSGACGTCAVTLVSGEVAYPERPPSPPEAGKALICCAFPAKGTGEVVLEI